MSLLATGKDFASESGPRDTLCNNGGCTRAVYRGKECFKCWLGTKWDSMKQRVENKRGHYPHWSGITFTIGRKEFVAWGLENPPPTDMKDPSVDRIISANGYVAGNIQWLPFLQNSRNKAKDVPMSHRRCTRCGQVKELSLENFHRNASNPLGFQSYCKSCRSSYV